MKPLKWKSNWITFWKGEQSVNLSLTYEHIFVQAPILIETFSYDWCGPRTSCWILKPLLFSYLYFEKDLEFNCTNLKFLDLRLSWAKFNDNYLFRTGKEECEKLFMYNFLFLNHLRWDRRLGNLNILTWMVFCRWWPKMRIKVFFLLLVHVMTKLKSNLSLFFPSMVAFFSILPVILQVM